MKLTARHAVGFLRLAAIELRRSAAAIVDGEIGQVAVLRVIADKCDAEAKDLNDALKEKAE